MAWEDWIVRGRLQSPSGMVEEVLVIERDTEAARIRYFPLRLSAAVPDSSRLPRMPLRTAKLENFEPALEQS
jgi:hypothetical protein